MLFFGGLEFRDLKGWYMDVVDLSAENVEKTIVYVLGCRV